MSRTEPCSDEPLTEALCILRIKEVKRRTALGRTTILAKEKDGTFPKSIKLSKRAVGWLSTEVDKWIAERMAARDGEAA